MAEVILFTNSDKLSNTISEILPQSAHNVYVINDIDECMKSLYTKNIDGVILDYNADSDLTLLSKKIRVVGKKKQPFVLLYSPIDYENDILFKYIDGFLPANASKLQIMTLITSALKLENNINELNKNNTVLAKNIYRLDVLYNTSSEFASTLNKKKLIDLMIQSIQRSVSPSFINVYIKETNILYMFSTRKPTNRLEEALKLRTAINYKEIFQDEEIDLSTLKIERNYIEDYSALDLQLFNYDNIFSLISLTNENYGFIEVFKESDFSQDDLTGIQSILKQVSSPLENAILYQEIKDTNTKLERLERLKSDFISIVSHELRTPLTPIKNSLDIILKGMAGDVTEQTKKFVTMAKRNVDRLSDIINDLLDLSKVEAGKMEFRFEVKSIIPTLDYIKSTFEQTARNKNISLTLDIGENIPDLYIDSKRMEQIISNIVSNALKFTPENGTVAMNCELVDTKELLSADLYEQTLNEQYNTYVKISVKDSGIGIKKDDIPKIFDKFQQIENSLSREVGGTGLGLPIAKQLTNAHGGIIWLESEPENGACFSVAIPVMNDKQRFITDLNHTLYNSKQSKKSVSLFMIVENNSEEVNNAIKNEKLTFFNNVSISNEVFYKEDGKNIYVTYAQEVDKFALNFAVKKLESFAKTDLTEKNAIMYSVAQYPTDGLTADILFEKLYKNTKNILEKAYEENINC